MSGTTNALSSLRIVVVEDDPTVREFLRQTLERDLKHQITGEATTGPEMIQKVLELEPDVVLFDIHLPGQDGLAALREIYEKRIVAAVAITADRDEELIGRALGEHVLAYLVKPVDTAQLAAALQVAWARFQELHNLTNENATLKQNLQNRKIIERAKGVLMKRHRWSEPEAFRRLQRSAMNRRVAMAALAQAVLDGQRVDL
jgi:response regulator NasT